jgi:preprotein translocase subunit SecD
VKIKLQLAILVALLVFLGTYLEQTTLSNQQIVIQFSDTDISSEDAENTIEIVKKQLQRLGVTNIQIGQHESGKLKITYYSVTAIERIQSILSKEDGFKFDYQSEHNNSNDLPDNRNLKNYELNISEIHNNSNINWDFEGIQITELNQKSDRYDSPKVNTFAEHLNTEYSNSLVNVATKVNNTVALARDKIAYKIPDVRAGPTYKGIILSEIIPTS